MDSCIICYEENDLIYPKNCNCRVLLHDTCLEKLIETCNIDCPICRNPVLYEEHRPVILYGNNVFYLVFLISTYTYLLFLMLLIVLSFSSIIYVIFILI